MVLASIKVLKAGGTAMRSGRVQQPEIKLSLVSRSIQRLVAKCVQPLRRAYLKSFWSQSQISWFFLPTIPLNQYRLTLPLRDAQMAAPFVHSPSPASHRSTAGRRHAHECIGLPGAEISGRCLSVFISQSSPDAIARPSSPGRFRAKTGRLAWSSRLSCSTS